MVVLEPLACLVLSSVFGLLEQEIEKRHITHPSGFPYCLCLHMHCPLVLNDLDLLHANLIPDMSYMT